VKEANGLRLPVLLEVLKWTAAAFIPARNHELQELWQQSVIDFPRNLYFPPIFLLFCYFLLTNFWLCGWQKSTET